jgi:AraC-like DNA-binding protein
MGRQRSLTPKLAAEIRRLLEHGHSKRAVARRFGISEMTLYRRLREVEDKRACAGRWNEDEGYPTALLRSVPRDYLPMLPRAYYLALVRVAERHPSTAAAGSLRQALLLHGEPVNPPPTSIELVLSAEEEEELRRIEEREPLRGSRGAEEPGSRGAGALTDTDLHAAVNMKRRSMNESTF